ncbi:DsbA family protein [Streptacidiphilus fuscans]|uniref:Thioredoxin domain-containing protein n=1 Tax=Streptacidiphilus fuscans TaxID=2789292 RepID=A0A931B5G8_9ACTN|nr:thioredoxin domain-containing protein [Streptacidiphilus fuscans]MBF9067245.1 thioredoxin domain-containing protein [Streptacidiphilus fuscans]
MSENTNPNDQNDQNDPNKPNTPGRSGRPTKREARASARERLAEQRAREQQVQARRRKVAIGAAVVAVVAIAAGIGLAVGNGNSGKSAASGPLVVPAHASGPNGTVIVYGNPNAKHTLDVWEDFRCPICDKLEKADGPTVQQLADNGTYKIQYHMATFLDNNLGGTGSIDALQVAGAALNEGGPTAFKEFHDVLYANQPPEETDGFGNVNTLLDLAKKVPGLVTPTFTKDVQDGVYAPWAQKVSDAFNSSGIQGTPTLKLDGQQLTVFDSQGNAITPAQYMALVQQTIASGK